MPRVTADSIIFFFSTRDDGGTKGKGAAVALSVSTSSLTKISMRRSGCEGVRA